jgi:YidC/Oxa1 family membrane protein insertase
MTRFPELSGIVEMDSKRLIIFIVLSMGILLLWQEYFAPKPAPQQVAQTQTASQPDAPASHTASAQPVEAAKLTAGQRIRVTTDVIKAEIDTVGGDLRQLDLLKHDSATDAKKPFELLTDKNGACMWRRPAWWLPAIRHCLPTSRFTPRHSPATP